MELVVGLLVATALLVTVMVAVPLAIGVWLLRRVVRARLVSRAAAALGFQLFGRRRTPSHAGLLGRSWGALVREARAAQTRFEHAVATVPDGPLRDRLRECADEVDAAVAEAVRIAEHGDRAERARHDVVRALDAQRRRRRRNPDAPADVRSSLEAAIDAQHSSAQRLAAVVQRDLGALELVVARLDELTAHGLELAAAQDPRQPWEAVAIADRVAALRTATAELDRAVTA